MLWDFNSLAFVITSSAVLLWLLGNIGNIIIDRKFIGDNCARLLQQLLLQLLKRWKIYGHRATCLTVLYIDMLILIRWLNFLVGVDEFIFAIQGAKAAEQ